MGRVLQTRIFVIKKMDVHSTFLINVQTENVLKTQKTAKSQKIRQFKTARVKN